jgi:GNAT superfamily N-acetyltransferase
MIFREAQQADIAAMHQVRNSVKENILSDPGRISLQDYEEYLFKKGKGWVCITDHSLIGFAIADLKGRNVWAIFIDPSHESEGIGKKLHDLMLNWYFSQTKDTIWLSTEPGTRAEGFYRKQGWKPVGMHGNEIRMEYDHEIWKIK